MCGKVLNEDMSTTTTAPEFRTWKQYGWTYTNRFLAVCKTKSGKAGCGHRFSVLDDSPFEVNLFPCPECGTFVKAERVVASESHKKCDARCLNAKRSSCECQCNGANHGTGS